MRVSYFYYVNNLPSKANRNHCERSIEALSFKSTVVLKSDLGMNKLVLSGDSFSGPKIRAWQTAGEYWFANSGGAESAESRLEIKQLLLQKIPHLYSLSHS